MLEWRFKDYSSASSSSTPSVAAPQEVGSNKNFIAEELIHGTRGRPRGLHTNGLDKPHTNNILCSKSQSFSSSLHALDGESAAADGEAHDDPEDVKS